MRFLAVLIRFLALTVVVTVRHEVVVVVVRVPVRAVLPVRQYSTAVVVRNVVMVVIMHESVVRMFRLAAGALRVLDGVLLWHRFQTPSFSRHAWPSVRPCGDLPVACP